MSEFPQNDLTTDGELESIRVDSVCAWARTRLAFDRLLRDRAGLAPLYLRDIARDDLCFYCQLCAGAACGIVVDGGDFARIERVITLGRPKNQRAESR